MDRPVSRLLRGYSLDPGFSTQLATMNVNEIIYSIRWEDLSKGPVGEYFEVIDVDPSSNCFYDPVDLNSIEVLATNGIAPSEGNPKFHQQFVYTIAMKTLDHFEHSLGRKILWRPRPYYTINKVKKDESEFVRRLRLYPHAFRDANAYYDPDKHAVLFGYFEAPVKFRFNNLPGGVIFSCLSPDIISHELTHAILDSIHPRFIEDTNPDVGGFHEAFADIVALLQRFTIVSLVEHQIAQTSGNLSNFSYLGELATQFGNAMEESRGALRSAIGSRDPVTGEWKKHIPDPGLYQTTTEAHDRGAILVATIFDAFLRLYHLQTADLIRIATNGTGILQPGAIHPDLVKRLAQEACNIAGHLLHICIRALDYCPPVDINYGDYLRALITADLDSSPKDTNGYRVALIEAFRSWGIFPENAKTLSIESLKWTRAAPHLTKAERSIWPYVANEIKEDLRELIDINLQENIDRQEIHNRSQALQAKLHTLLMGPMKIGSAPQWNSFLNKLGLTNKPLSFKYGGEIITSKNVPKLEVHKIRPVYRVGREGKILEQVLITLSQTFYIERGALEGTKFRGGCSLILNMSRNYDVEYIIYKKISSTHRFEKQMNYQTGTTEGENLSFRVLHHQYH